MAGTVLDDTNDTIGPRRDMRAIRTTPTLGSFGGGHLPTGTTYRKQAMLRKSIILAATLAGVVAAVPAQAQLAIAFDPSTGRAAAYAGTTDAARNQREAISSCGSGCRIVATGKRTCAAVAESISTGGSIWGVGYGTTTSVASQNAYHACRNKGGVTCKTAASICD